MHRSCRMAVAYRGHADLQTQLVYTIKILLSESVLANVLKYDVNNFVYI